MNCYNGNKIRKRYVHKTFTSSVLQKISRGSKIIIPIFYYLLINPKFIRMWSVKKIFPGLFTPQIAIPFPSFLPFHSFQPSG